MRLLGLEVDPSAGAGYPSRIGTHALNILTNTVYVKTGAADTAWTLASVFYAGGYTDEQAQDAVGGILTDSAEIDFTYDDATPSITAVVIAIAQAKVTGLVAALAGKASTTHAPTHSNGSSDPVTVTNLAGFPGGTATFLRADATFAAPPVEVVSGTATLNFGAFPGASDTSVAVTGQTGIVAGSTVDAWIRPVATADHSADEHLVETLDVVAGNIVAGTGFTIYGINEGIGDTRLYGQWTVAWQWS